LRAFYSIFDQVINNINDSTCTSLPRSQPFLVLLPMQDKMEGEFFLQRLRTSSAKSYSPTSGLSHIRASPAHHLWHYFFHFLPLQTLERGPTVGSAFVEFLRAHISRKGSDSITTTTLPVNFENNLCEIKIF